MSLFEIQRICASPASPSAIFSYRREWDGFRKGVDLAEKRIFCIIKQGKKTREVTSPGPWPLIKLLVGWRMIIKGPFSLISP